MIVALLVYRALLYRSVLRTYLVSVFFFLRAIWKCNKPSRHVDFILPRRLMLRLFHENKTKRNDILAKLLERFIRQL